MSVMESNSQFQYESRVLLCNFFVYIVWGSEIYFLIPFEVLRKTALSKRILFMVRAEGEILYGTGFILDLLRHNTYKYSYASYL